MKNTILAGSIRLEEQLGKGGMGSVYKATQLDMNRTVVVKLIHKSLASSDPQAVERFKREAQTIAKLNHPHIVQIFLSGETEEKQCYLVMEYIEGKELAELIHNTPMPKERALRILDQVASALEEAHAHGIVHRDLKPENIMLTHRHGNPDWALVLDFGIAKAKNEDPESALTQTGTFCGTPKYMAPEQIQGLPTDERADLYALGIILYEMLTGHHPFRADSSFDYLMQHVHAPVPDIQESHPELQVSKELRELLATLLEKDPKNRCASASLLRQKIADISASFPGFSLGGSAGIQTPKPTSNMPSHAPKKNKLLLPVLLLLVLVISLLSVFLFKTKLSLEGKHLAETSAQLTPLPIEDLAKKTVNENQAGSVENHQDSPLSASASPEDFKLSRAIHNIERLPVPETSLLQHSGEGSLTLSIEAPLDAVEAFYEDLLGEEALKTADGFALEVGFIPFDSLTFIDLDSQTIIQAERRKNAPLRAEAQVGDEVEDEAEGEFQDDKTALDENLAPEERPKEEGEVGLPAASETEDQEDEVQADKEGEPANKAPEAPAAASPKPVTPKRVTKKPSAPKQPKEPTPPRQPTSTRARLKAQRGQSQKDKTSKSSKSRKSSESNRPKPIKRP